MKMKKWTAAALILVLLMGAFTGCGSKQSTEKMYDTGVSYSATQDYAMAAGVYDMAESEEIVSDNALMSMKRSGAEDSTAQTLPQNRKWIVTMNISAETDDLDAALAAVSGQILALGGYVESQNISNSTSYRRARSASLTVRIPAENADSFAEEISGFTNVVSHSRSVQDITLSYTDTEGRVNALKTEETRLLELMEMADNMSDLLEIEERLTEVRYQLERHASTLRLYDNQVDYATISLYISEVVKFTPVEEPGFFQKIKDGLSDSIIDLGQSLVEFVEWIIIDLPYLILWGLVIWGGVAIVKRIVRKKKGKKQAAKEEKQA